MGVLRRSLALLLTGSGDNNIEAKKEADSASFSLITVRVAGDEVNDAGFEKRSANK